MSFPYFYNPSEFSHLAESGKVCHFCKTTKDCLHGGCFVGLEVIDAICFSCMKEGKLIEMENVVNEIDVSALDPYLGDSQKISDTIVYCTPQLPMWQDPVWPVKEGRPYPFIKIACQHDYSGPKDFLESLFECDPDPDLWDMLPEHRIENLDDGEYETVFYLFKQSYDKLTVWDSE